MSEDKKDDKLNEEPTQNDFEGQTEDSLPDSDQLVDDNSKESDVPNTARDGDQSVDSEADSRLTDENAEKILLESYENDEAVNGEAVSSAAGAAAAVSTAKVKTGRPLAVFAVLLSLMALAGSSAAGWFYYQYQQAAEKDTTAKSNQVKSIADSVDDQFKVLKQLESTLVSTQQALAKQSDEQAMVVEQLSKQLSGLDAQAQSHARRLLAMTATTTDDWRVAEVDYLLRLANQRLMISSDAATALSLIDAADEILLELSDPRLLPAREAIADDRAALLLVADLDVDGIFLKLSAINKHLGSLPVVSAPTFDAAGFDQARAEPTESSAADVVPDDGGVAPFLQVIADVFTRGWHEIKSWMVINRSDATIKPLLPPEQQYYLRSNLRLMINQAQIALLEQRQVPYQDSLQNAIQWLLDYFPQGEDAVQNLIDELQLLVQVDINPDYPNLSNSLLQLKGFINSQFNTGSVTESQTTVDQESSADADADADADAEEEAA